MVVRASADVQAMMIENLVEEQGLLAAQMAKRITIRR